MKNHQDIIIIGAGLSGIGAACHLSKKCPDKTYTILEGRPSMGGTWDLFKYPGIRSDSDMYTLGYNFKPWLGDKSLADGPAILEYIKEAAHENNVEGHIQYNRKVKSIDWSTENNIWTVQVVNTQTGEDEVYTAQFVWSCTGYYNYEEGYLPEFNGYNDFSGKIIHPQFWPEDYDYSDKNVVVIGSGATAVTLVPAMTDKAAHVTMLQRTPTYVSPLPSENKVSKISRKYFSEKTAYKTTRTFQIGLQMFMYWYCRKFPNSARKFFDSTAKKVLKGKVDIKHFQPSYKPWDQRVCAIPDGDLFKLLREGKASIVTAHIDKFIPEGILLTNGEKLPADVIVTATGLKLLPIGGIKIFKDGKDFDFSQKMNYKGMMLEDAPNFVFTSGYTNASWTLKADLVSDFMCRLINYMDSKKYTTYTPENKDQAIEHVSMINLNSGYINRDIHRFPKQGSKLPWRLHQNYIYDFFMLKKGKMIDDVLVFGKGKVKDVPEMVV